MNEGKKAAINRLIENYLAIRCSQHC